MKGELVRLRLGLKVGPVEGYPVGEVIGPAEGKRDES